MSAVEQGRVFLAMTVCGVGLAAVYDVLALLPLHGFLRGMLDLCFGGVGAAGMAWTALAMRAEAFRLYTFAGVACGAALYAVTIGTIVRILREGVRTLSKKGGILPKTSQKMQENEEPTRID